MRAGHSLDGDGDHGPKTAQSAFVQRYVTAMAPDDVSRYRQPKTRISRVLIARLVEPVEGAKDFFAILCWDPGSVIFDRDVQTLRRMPGFDEYIICEPG